MNVVFAIGCRRYRDPRVAQLKYADQDARRFVETVMRTQDPDNTKQYLLHDEHENEDFRPTRANILYFLSLGEERDKSTKIDFLFFYFSGHGWSSQEGPDYLLTSDSIVTMLQYTAISVPMLEGHLRNWEAKHVVLFVDACRTVMAGGKGLTIEEGSRVNVDSLCPPGMVTFCSCEPGQTSYESDAIQSGLFTYGVCKALSDEGRCSTIQQLNDYLTEKVPEISQAYGLPLQTPYTRVEPLTVQNAIIVAKRTLEGWRVRKYEEPEQFPPERTPEAPLASYRERVKWVSEEGLTERGVQRLSDYANELNISQSDASAIEREVIGDTKEEILKRQEQSAKEQEEIERRKWLDERYAEARRLHHDRNWQAVVGVFDQIRAEDPTYSDPEELLNSARQALERAENEQHTVRQYRNAVQSAWADVELDKRDVDSLRGLARELKLSSTNAARIESEVLGATKEEVLKQRYRDAVKQAWTSADKRPRWRKWVEGHDIPVERARELQDLAINLGLGMDAANIEREILGKTIKEMIKWEESKHTPTGIGFG